MVKKLCFGQFYSPFFLFRITYNNGRREKDIICWYVWHVQAIVRTGINCFGLGGLDENVNERILSAALITFGEIKEIQMPVDPGTS